MPNQFDVQGFIKAAKSQNPNITDNEINSYLTSKGINIGQGMTSTPSPTTPSGFDIQGFRNAARQSNPNITDEQINQYLVTKGINFNPQEDKSVGGFIGNIFKSGANLIGGVASAIAHPIKTIKGVGQIALGGIQKLSGDETSNTQAFDSVANFLKERYGGVEQIKNTLYTDPVGVLADISTVLGGAGLTAQAAKFGDVAKILSKAGELTNPVSQGLKLAGKGAELATAGKNIAPFANKVDTGISQIAKERGVGLPASSMSSSGAVGLAEKTFGGSKLATRVAEANQKLTQIADDVVASTGVTGDLTQIGESIAKGFKKFTDTYKEQTSKLYDVFNKTGREIPADTTTTLSTLKDILVNKGQVLGGDSSAKFFQNILDEIEGAGAGKLTFENLKKTRSAIGTKIGSKFIDSFVKENVGDLKKLYGALSEDLNKTVTAKDAGLGQQLAEAESFYQAGLEKMNTAYGKKINNLAQKGQFDKIVPAIVNPKTSIEDIPKIMEVIGQENIPKIQSSILDDVFTKAKNAEGNFQTNGIARQIKSYSPEKLQAILTPEQFRAVSDLDKLTRALSQGQKIAKPSELISVTKALGGASLVGTAIGDLLKGNIAGFITKLSPVIGEVAFSKFISSDSGQKLLTTGLRLNGRVGKAIQKTQGIGKLATPLSRFAEAQSQSE